MANRLWLGNPGCSTEPCCDTEDPVNDPCCVGIAPTTLYLNDGFGEVPLIYNGPRPIGSFFLPGPQTWWGCAFRTASIAGTRSSPGANSCDGTFTSQSIPIVFGLYCENTARGFRLAIFYHSCNQASGSNTGDYLVKPRSNVGGVSAIIPDENACTTTWDGANIGNVVGLNGGVAASDCSPFIWGPHSANFPATPTPVHPLRHIYGDTGTWIITS
jgi:hypothetical protein